MQIKTIANAFLLSAFFAQSVFLSVLPQRVFAQEASEAETDIITETIQSYLVISAVQITGGTGKTQEDFVELYNPTTEPFDLNGYRLVKRTAVGTTDILIKAWDMETIVPAHHFYLWANSGFASIQILPDVVSSATLADNNGIALRKDESEADGESEPDFGQILGSLAWGSTANGFDNKSASNPGANEALARAELFESSSDFNIQPSIPRNSSVVLEQATVPEDEPDPEAEEPQEEDSGPAEQTAEEDETLVNIKITEILPNPPGSDAGFEQIELYNAGSAAVALEGYKMDDISPNQPLSSNAYVFPRLEIQPESYLSIIVPAGSMSLNNTGGDIVSLFNTQGGLAASAFYEGTAPEGKSYSYFPSGWQWSEPSFGELNVQPAKENEDDETDEEEKKDDEILDEADYDNSGLEITEIFPQPDSSGTEFVEIYNAGSELAQLSKVAIYVGDRKKLLPEHELRAGEYFVIEQSLLPVQLRNSGQTIKLQEDAMVLSTITYPAAIENSSFAKFEDGFLWTTQVTKAADNILEIPEAVKKEVAEVAAKTAVKKPASSTAKTTTKSTTSAAVAKTTAANAGQPVATGEKEANTAENLENTSAESTKKQRESLAKILAMGAAAVAGGVVALYKLVLTATAE